MKKYIVTTINYQGQITYGYDDNNQLVLVELDGIHEQQHRINILKNLPLTLDVLNKWTHNNKNITVTLLLEDITFEVFWSNYNYKMGKQEAERAWNKLSVADKTRAIKRIRAYDRYISDRGIAKAYAQKYLNQRRFNDEF